MLVINGSEIQRLGLSNFINLNMQFSSVKTDWNTFTFLLCMIVLSCEYLLWFCSILMFTYTKGDLY